MRDGFHVALGLLLVTAPLVLTTPARADAPAQRVVSACERGMFDLDCACVAAEFEDAAAGAKSADRTTLASMVSVMLGIEPDPDTMDLTAIANLGDRLNTLEDLTNQCAASAAAVPAPAPEQNDARVARACRNYPGSIDCGCVADTYDNAAAGTSPAQRAAIADLTITNLGGAVSADLSQLAERNRLLGELGDQVQPLNDLDAVCPGPLPAGAAPSSLAQAEGYPDPVSDRPALRQVGAACMDSDFDLDCGCVGDALIEACPTRQAASAPAAAPSQDSVVSACQQGGLPLDCQCVADRFDAAVESRPAAGRAYASAVAATALHGTPARAVTDFPPETALQYAELADQLTDPRTGLVAPACVDGTTPGLQAARAAGERSAGLPGGDLTARASAGDWRDAVRMECQGFGNTAAYCGCRSELYAQNLSSPEARLMGEMIRRYARYSLGQIGHEAVDAERVAADLGYAPDTVRPMLNRIENVRSSESLATQAALICHPFRR